MVYQDLSLCDTIDVAGNLFLGREPTPAGPLARPAADDRRGPRHLDAPGDPYPQSGALVAQLSGGQRQSIAIGRAAAFEPRVLIMDEPTSALAVAEVEAVLRLIRRLAARGVAIVLITHRLQDLFRVCDRIAVMYEGIKVAERRIGETDLEDLVGLIVGEKADRSRCGMSAPAPPRGAAGLGHGRLPQGAGASCSAIAAFFLLMVLLFATAPTRS